MEKESFYITNHTKGKLKSLPFSKIKGHCVGQNFEVSLVFIGEKKARFLNYRYRKKKYVPNVLSFPLGNNSGEIFICPKQAARDAKKFGMNSEKFLPFLFIHALFHLKGLSHGSTMEKKEASVRKKFRIA
ncbi:MAG: rRNA maturation RNase YbeY [Candidatus Pacebacteria bacterium]|nr:rRNA maturation RNase YbeY [Candidatus Paceibacterota bacterium]